MNSRTRLHSGHLLGVSNFKSKTSPHEWHLAACFFGLKPQFVHSITLPLAAFGSKKTNTTPTSTNNAKLISSSFQKVRFSVGNSGFSATKNLQENKILISKRKVPPSGIYRKNPYKFWRLPGFSRWFVAESVGTSIFLQPDSLLTDSTFNNPMSASFFFNLSPFLADKFKNL